VPADMAKTPEMAAALNSMSRFDAILVFPGHASQELGRPVRPGDAAWPGNVKIVPGKRGVTEISNGSDEVHQHSGWWFPFAILLAILVLSGIVLLYYLRPG